MASYAMRGIADLMETDGCRDAANEIRAFVEEHNKVRLELEKASREKGIFQSLINDLQVENMRLVNLINNPHTNSFLDAVRLEAAHQRERWAADHDAAKTDADWYWLIGHLASKAVYRIRDKQLHHIITTAAACLNWHMARTDERPSENTSPSTPGLCMWDDDPDEAFKSYWRTGCGNHSSRVGYETVPVVCGHCGRYARLYGTEI